MSIFNPLNWLAPRNGDEMIRAMKREEKKTRRTRFSHLSDFGPEQEQLKYEILRSSIRWSI